MKPSVGARLGAYLAAVSLAGAAVIAVAVIAVVDHGLAGISPIGWLLLGLIVVTELWPIQQLPRRGGGEVTVSAPFALALLLLEGVPVAVLAMAGGAVLGDLLRRKTAEKVVFNTGQYAVAMGAAGVVYLRLSGGGVPAPALGAIELAAFIAAAAVLLLVNISLTAVAVALAQGLTVSRQLRRTLSVHSLINLALIALAPIVAVAADRGAVFVLLLLLPVAAIRASARLLVQRQHAEVHDPLTGLPNRRLLREQAEANGQRLALLLLDVDGFRKLQEQFGHETGDALLHALGRRLAALAGDQCEVGHLGGDQFCMLLEGAEVADGEAYARLVLDVLEEPIKVAGLPLHVAASIGIACAPLHGTDFDDLLQRADVAVQLAKERASGAETYTADREEESRQRRSLLADLPRAIDAGELVLHYQPAADIRTGDIVGMEALVRWRHPQHGLVAPGRFIPQAEQTAVMRRLTRRVLDAALAQCAAWRGQGIVVRMAVNLSARDLHVPGLPREVLDAAARHALPPQALAVELTESALMADRDRAAGALAELAAAGVQIAVDDFGTGYSSLGYLKWLPVQIVKIDQSFVAGMAANPHDDAIVRTAIEMARHLRLDVVAEGVEDGATWTRLRELGCDYAQGFHLSPPLSVEDATVFLEQRAAAVTLARTLSSDG